MMRTVSKALTAGYKKSLEWWAGIELAKRFFLVTLVVSLPGRTVCLACIDAISVLSHFTRLVHYYLSRPYSLYNSILSRIDTGFQI